MNIINVEKELGSQNNYEYVYFLLINMLKKN